MTSTLPASRSDDSYDFIQYQESAAMGRFVSRLADVNDDDNAVMNASSSSAQIAGGCNPRRSAAQAKRISVKVNKPRPQSMIGMPLQSSSSANIQPSTSGSELPASKSSFGMTRSLSSTLQRAFTLTKLSRSGSNGGTSKHRRTRSAQEPSTFVSRAPSTLEPRAPVQLDPIAVRYDCTVPAQPPRTDASPILATAETISGPLPTYTKSSLNRPNTLPTRPTQSRGEKSRPLSLYNVPPSSIVRSQSDGQTSFSLPTSPMSTSSSFSMSSSTSLPRITAKLFRMRFKPKSKAAEAAAASPVMPTVEQPSTTDAPVAAEVQAEETGDDKAEQKWEQESPRKPFYHPALEAELRASVASALCDLQTSEQELPAQPEETAPGAITVAEAEAEAAFTTLAVEEQQIVADADPEQASPRSTPPLPPRSSSYVLPSGAEVVTTQALPCIPQPYESFLTMSVSRSCNSVSRYEDDHEPEHDEEEYDEDDSLTVDDEDLGIVYSTQPYAEIDSHPGSVAPAQSAPIAIWEEAEHIPVPFLATIVEEEDTSELREQMEVQHVLQPTTTEQQEEVEEIEEFDEDAVEEVEEAAEMIPTSSSVGFGGPPPSSSGWYIPAAYHSYSSLPAASSMASMASMASCASLVQDCMTAKQVWQDEIFSGGPPPQQEVIYSSSNALTIPSASEQAEIPRRRVSGASNAGEVITFNEADRSLALARAAGDVTRMTQIDISGALIYPKNPATRTMVTSRTAPQQLVRTAINS